MGRNEKKRLEPQGKEFFDFWQHRAAGLRIRPRPASIKFAGNESC